MTYVLNYAHIYVSYLANVAMHVKILKEQSRNHKKVMKQVARWNQLEIAIYNHDASACDC